MIQYPNGIKKNTVSKQTSYKNRGMTLEQDINSTNRYYLDLDKAVIHKKPVPIQVVTVDYPSRNAAKITEAYYKVPSTTDYNGVYRGKAIDFEAKETRSTSSFTFKNFHEHQIVHLQQVLNHGAIGFVIIRFKVYDETYLVKADDVVSLYYGKRKSIPYAWFKEHAYLIPYSLTPPVNYLKVIDQLYFKGE